MQKRYARAAALTFLFAFVGLFTSLSACGRSALEGYEQDASPDVVGRLDAGDAGDAEDASDAGDASDGDASTCNAANCAEGCCDAKGKCQNGTLLSSCGGARGVACTDCTAKGFDFCDATLRVCAREVATCNATTCPDGCCGTSTPGPDAGTPKDAGGPVACFQGTSGQACGAGGAACAACKTGSGEICDPALRSCVNAACSPANCPGCCIGNQCRIGQDNAACGVKGAACTDCRASKTSCIPTSGTVGGTCEGPPPLCGPANCPNGCCLGDQCIAGTIDTACGKGGLQCANCAAQSQVCTGQACITPTPTCNIANCPGCCDAAGTCNAGFLNTRCGSQANACQNCLGSGSTCNGAVTPRSCNNQQNTCPARYPSCAAAVTVPAPPGPASKGSCATNDLADARAACGPGADSASCQAYFAFLDAAKPGCSACLAPFHYTFAEANGIYTCVQPFVGTNCNHTTGCAIDCSATSCTQCPGESARTQCENNVRSGNGQCRTYYQQSACVAQGLFSSGAFCNPASYAGNYGSWLQGVGGHYCAP